MPLDEVTISKIIIEKFSETFIKDGLDVDVAIAGGGPAGLTAGRYLAENGIKTCLFERKLSIGGGMWGGGMMMPVIVVQEAGKQILDDFEVKTEKYAENYYHADAIEAVTKLAATAIDKGLKIFNLISIEDVMIRENDRVTGFVILWTAVSMAKLHVDPLTIQAKVVIDATGHDADICRVIERKIPNAKFNTPSGKIASGEKPMWADIGEETLYKNTVEIYPGVIVAGMACNAVFASPRMGPIFGGMMVSGKRAAELAIKMLKD